MREGGRAFDDEALKRALEQIDATVITEGEKGFAALAGLSARDVVAKGLTVGDLGTPVAVLDDLTVRRNITSVQSWCDARGVLFAPHVKTTMSPLLISHQLRAGAWGVTVATVTHAAALVSLGARRIMIANQVVDEADVAVLQRLRRSYPDLTVYCFVDSVEGVSRLEDAVAGIEGPAEPLPVLLEVGVAAGRAGIRSDAEADRVSRRVSASPTVRLVGAAAFEGVLGSDRSRDSRNRVTSFVSTLVSISQRIRTSAGADKDPSWLCSAGGSLYLDLVAEVLRAPGLDHTVVLRSGGVVTYDDGYLGAQPFDLDGASLAPALELRASVLSIPERGLALLGLGKRDVGSDLQFPNPRSVLTERGRIDISDHRITALNDQHAYLRPPEGSRLHPSLTVGSRVALGIAHPCTTFDKWRRIAVADETDHVVGVATTLF